MKLSQRLQEAVDTAPKRSFEFAPPTPGSGANALDQFKIRVHQALLARLGGKLFDATLAPEQLTIYVAQEIAEVMSASPVPLSTPERQRLTEEILEDVVGLGPLERYLTDPTVSEIMVNSLAPIFVERRGVIEQTRSRFLSEDHLRRVIERIVGTIGRRIDESSPMVDARLPDG